MVTAMPASREERRARRLLRACAATRPGVGRVSDRGYEWLRDRFVPALECLTTLRDPRDADLLAVSWDTLSVIHYMHDGYGPALSASLMCVELAPQDDWCRAWLAVLYLKMGQWELAWEAYRCYLELAPPCQEWPLPGFGSFEDDDLESDPVRYDPATWQSKVADLLADFRPQDAVPLVARRRSLEGLRWKARVYGALDDREKALDVWRQLARWPGPLSLEDADWFYLPRAFESDPRFWEVMVDLSSRPYEASVLVHDSLSRALPVTGNDACRERQRLMCEFHVARTSRNASRMRELSERVPAWTEARDWVVLLQRS